MKWRQTVAFCHALGDISDGNQTDKISITNPCPSELLSESVHVHSTVQSSIVCWYSLKGRQANILAYAEPESPDSESVDQVHSNTDD